MVGCLNRSRFGLGRWFISTACCKRVFHDGFCSLIYSSSTQNIQSSDCDFQNVESLIGFHCFLLADLQVCCNASLFCETRFEQILDVSYHDRLQLTKLEDIEAYDETVCRKLQRFFNLFGLDRHSASREIHGLDYSLPCPALQILHHWISSLELQSLARNPPLLVRQVPFLIPFPAFSSPRPRRGLTARHHVAPSDVRPSPFQDPVLPLHLFPLHEVRHQDDRDSSCTSRRLICLG